MHSQDIRRTFLEFFQSADHRVWPSSSLIPHDPTVFLTIAGMVQFKPYFQGEAVAPHPRAVSVQKCVRISGKQDDIENIGRTTRHLTFMEMLGNFSFGDYFKREAIRWGWELSTEGFGFDPDRIWATVFEEDDEAEQLWLSETDLPAERIVRRGKADNFWSMGGAGPCGPCSELFYDRGPDHGAEGGPAVDENRYVEFWNLVFMQYQQDDDGELLGTLPKQSVDTGMGMERMAMLTQDVANIFETDVVRPMLDRASELTSVAYGADEGSDVSLRVLADHARSTSLLIADGVLPSNEMRGYVLRRLLRRMVRHARLLGSERQIMGGMTDAVRTVLGATWPELVQQSELVTRVTAAEEQSFARTLQAGMGLLDTAIAQAKEAGEPAIPAKTAFTLHDTHGFPVDLTVEIAAEAGLTLDRDAFAAHMDAQRSRARTAVKRGGDGGVGADAYKAVARDLGATEFLGYTDQAADTRIGALLVPGGPLASAGEGDEVEVVLPRTPFYAEGGGQLGDHGVITTETGRLEVVDTQQPLQGLVVHRARVAAGEVTTGQDARAQIDSARRAAITRGHTATHLLHATLREVVGEHAAQAGSAIDAGRFRFDFPHFSAVSANQLAEVEGLVNTRITADPAIETVEASQQDARAMGATALFGERYGDTVRVVRIGDFSLELCGGTHVARTPDVGLFTILSEGSIAANLRRIEAVTGPDAFQFLARERLVAEQVAGLLKVPTDEVVARVTGLVERLRAAERALDAATQQATFAAAGSLLDLAERVGDVTVLVAALDGADRDALKALATDLRNRAGLAVVVLGTVTGDGSALLCAAVSPELGISAAEVLRPAAQAVGGGAGGKGDVAQAGGKRGDQLAQALDAARADARTRLTKP